MSDDEARESLLSEWSEEDLRLILRALTTMEKAAAVSIARVMRKAGSTEQEIQAFLDTMPEPPEPGQPEAPLASLHRSYWDYGCLADQVRSQRAAARGEYAILTELAKLEIPPSPIERLQELENRNATEWHTSAERARARLERLQALPGGCPEIILDHERELIAHAEAGEAWMKYRTMVDEHTTEHGGDE